MLKYFSKSSSSKIILPQMDSPRINSPKINSPRLISLTGLNQNEAHIICTKLFRKLEYESTDHIKTIIKNYDDDCLVHMIELFMSQLVIQINLYHILPLTHGPIIFSMIQNMIPEDTIESISHRININFQLDNGNTCLWNVTNIEYLIKLLSSKLMFNINCKNNYGISFFLPFISQYSCRKDTNQIKLLIDILIEKKYDFNCIYSGLSVLDIFLLKTYPRQLINSLINIVEYDHTICTLWLYVLIQKYSIEDLRSIICRIVDRPDYKSFLNRIMGSYSYATADADMLLIMNLINGYDPNKLIKMITFKNNRGNTLGHIATKNYLYRTIRFIFDILPDLKSSMNSNDKTPRDLYLEHSMLDIL